MLKTLVILIVALKLYALPSPVQQKIPITVLSGFLGSGKTTLLQHLLNNSEGLKIAVIVNDVAEVNIDNKLIIGNSASSLSKEKKGPAGIVELSNGCACCSISDELLPAVSELITLSDMKSQAGGENSSFDHIVIELSGVASPKSIRANFQEAELYGMPLLERVKLDTMVTLIDCSSFLDHMKDDDGRRVNQEESPELFYKNDKEGLSQMQEENDMMSIRSISSQWTPETATISQLLTEQTEISDVILLNKIDVQSQEETIKEIRDIVEMLNPRAKIFQTKFGIVNQIKDVLAAASGEGVVDAGTVDDFKDSIQSYEEMNYSSQNKSVTTCNDPDCLDDSHSHSHHHHEHHHEHPVNENECHDPGCTDQSHSHTHSHQRSNSSGMGTFIYRARKPFHPQRLESVLSMLPAKRGLSAFTKSNKHSQSTNAVFGKVLRCKGFSWLANSHIACQFLSHAGSSFEMHILGRWWATLPRMQWPEEAIEDILSDFDNKHHNEKNENIESVGDRRQEIVWIGPGLDKADHQMLIQQCLDECLLTDEEYEDYKKTLSDENKLREMFPTSIQSKMMSY